ncbi:hypothetical protein B0T16DRAFT_426781 [Cercophora newfieldiana]|uniref:Uncharacterized protein n=1 Tax=Cercophora newfieldiana TaxID=92897 RepID=A0AA39YGH1_9PEZI|nr:hypothetical protein B0T16DRAFT_426781 [Cercophora newfieldiana]
MSLAGTPTVHAGQPVPRLAEPLEAETNTGNSTPRAIVEGEEKKKKRTLFGFGKKKTEDPAKPPPARSEPTQTVAARRSVNASPVQIDHSHFVPTSPSRAFASSPRLASPAGSQIFERDVQESTTLPPNSPAIPSHIQTENYIPPVLDASSEAITDGHLDPNDVEIITHTSHQPAAVAVTGGGLLEPSWADELAAFASEKGTDSASNYGSLDTTDVRRLSFISFADVVQAEQSHGIAGSRDSMHLAGLTSLASMGITNRSPSPIRSPVSSAGGPETSPPTSKSGSVKGLEMSPSRKPLGSPGLQQPPPGSPTVNGELSIETMSQALRRTGSGDLSGVRSLPSSPI